MFVCLAAFLILAVAMVFWPFVWVFSKKKARNLWKAFRGGVVCLSKRTRFQKCEVKYEDKVKGLFLKKVILKKPAAAKRVSRLIQGVSVLIVFGFVVGVVALVFMLIS